MLQILDRYWKEHLANMDHLRQGIHLRSYAQKDPRQEFKREAFELFTQMLDQFKRETIELLARVQIRSQEEIEELERLQREAAQAQQMEMQHAQANQFGEEEKAEAEQEKPAQQPFVRAEKKVGRNDPCPCGSGKKYKQCHGKLT